MPLSRYCRKPLQIRLDGSPSQFSAKTPTVNQRNRRHLQALRQNSKIGSLFQTTVSLFFSTLTSASAATFCRQKATLREELYDAYVLIHMDGKRAHHGVRLTTGWLPTDIRSHRYDGWIYGCTSNNQLAISSKERSCSSSSKDIHSELHLSINVL